MTTHGTPFAIAATRGEAHLDRARDFNGLRGYASLMREVLIAWSAHRAPSMGAALAFYVTFSIAIALVFNEFTFRSAQRDFHFQIAHPLRGFDMGSGPSCVELSEVHMKRLSGFDPRKVCALLQL